MGCQDLPGNVIYYDIERGKHYLLSQCKAQRPFSWTCRKAEETKRAITLEFTQPAATGPCWSSQIQVGQVYLLKLLEGASKEVIFLYALKQLDQLQVDSFHLRLTQHSSSQGKYSSSASGSSIVSVCTGHYKAGTKQTLVRHSLSMYLFILSWR